MKEQLLDYLRKESEPDALKKLQAYTGDETSMVLSDESVFLLNKNAQQQVFKYYRALAEKEKYKETSTYPVGAFNEDEKKALLYKIHPYPFSNWLFANLRNGLFMMRWKDCLRLLAWRFGREDFDVLDISFEWCLESFHHDYIYLHKHPIWNYEQQYARDMEWYPAMQALGFSYPPY